ncbi:MAG: alpha/beta fold hydrolase [Bacteroidota bacterium]
MRTIVLGLCMVFVVTGTNAQLRINDAFTFPLNPSDVFTDRSGQFISSGVPATTLAKAKSSIKDMWTNGAGGWIYEWSELAKEAENKNDYLQASLLYGIAKYPCLINRSQREAFDKQLHVYMKAIKDLPYKTERKVVMVDYKGITTPVVYHIIYAAQPTQAPVLLLSGGVDTYKIDMHGRAAALVPAIGANVVMIDMPGTGESQVALSPDDIELYKNFIAQVRPIGNGKVGYLGFSFGGYWAARLAMLRIVDAAVAAGAPLNDAFLNERRSDGMVLQPQLGMRGVLSYAFKYDGIAPDSTLLRELKRFSLTRLGEMNDIKTNPLILVNGDDDPYIPKSDVTRFEGISNIETRLLPGGGHCGAKKLGEVMPWIVGWLKEKLN